MKGDTNLNVFQNFRVKKQLTQEQVATLLSVDRSTVAKWETGSSLPRASLLPRIAKIFNCKVEDLLKK